MASAMPDEKFPEVDAQRRFEATLRGALKTPPLPHGKPVKNAGGKNSPLAHDVREARAVVHASDCAIHSAPAYEAGECDCAVNLTKDANGIQMPVLTRSSPAVRPGLRGAGKLGAARSPQPGGSSISRRSTEKAG